VTVNKIRQTDLQYNNRELSIFVQLKKRKKKMKNEDPLCNSTFLIQHSLLFGFEPTL